MGCAIQNDAHRKRQIESVSDTDKDGFDSCLCAHHRTDDFLAVPQANLRAAPGGRLAVRPNQSALRAADRGQVADDPKVAGDAKPPWMRHALPVAQEQIRLLMQSPQRGQKRRRLAKGEQPWNVGKQKPTNRRMLLNHLLLLRIPKHDRGKTQLVVA